MTAQRGWQQRENVVAQHMITERRAGMSSSPSNSSSALVAMIAHLWLTEARGMALALLV